MDLTILPPPHDTAAADPLGPLPSDGDERAPPPTAVTAGVRSARRLVIPELLAVLMRESAVFPIASGAHKSIEPPLPIEDLLDVSTRVIESLVASAMNVALPQSRRDQGLAFLIRVMRLLQGKIFAPRLCALAEFWADPSLHLTTLRRDIDAVCASPEYYARVEPTVQRALQPQGLGNEALVSNLCTLVMALAPFDVIWHSLLGAGRSYSSVLAAEIAATAPCNIGLASIAFMTAATRQFAVPPETPAVDPDGVVVGSAVSKQLRRQARKAAMFAAAAQSTHEHTGRGEETLRSTAMERRGQNHPTAVIQPPQLSDAPVSARFGTANLVRSVLAGTWDEQRADDMVRAAEPQLMPRPQSARAIAISARLQAIAATAEPPAAKAHRQESSGTRDPPPPPPPPWRPPSTKKLVGIGIPRLAIDVERLVLHFLTPRALRAAQCTCRRFALLIHRNRELRAATQLAWHFGRRLEWFLEDEWGERVTSLPRLPPSLGGDVGVVFVAENVVWPPP